MATAAITPQRLSTATAVVSETIVVTVSDAEAPVLANGAATMIETATVTGNLSGAETWTVTGTLTGTETGLDTATEVVTAMEIAIATATTRTAATET